MVAAREGGKNPDFNARLRTAIERARTEELPKENIERAIARAEGGGDAGALQEFLYEATAPAGVLILIEGITDNKNRTLAEIKKILAERGAHLAGQGNILWNFEKIGALEITKRDNPKKDVDGIELAIMESGAEDFDITNTGWFIATKLPGLDRVRSVLEERGIKIHACSPAFRPRAPLPLGEDARAAIEPLLDALADHDDIQKIYTNLND